MPTPLRRLNFEQKQDLALHRDLMRAANAYLAARHDHRFADRGFFGKILLLILLCAGCYTLSVLATGPGLFLVAYGLFIVFAMLLAVNVVHDASHNVVFRRAWANRLLNVIVSIPLGMDPDCWRVRHVIFHHAHVNVEDYDLDIDANGVLRQTPFQQRRGFMRWQNYYWPLVAALTFPCIIWYFDWLDRSGKTRVTPKMALQGARGWGLFLFSKLAHLLLALVLPYWLLAGTISLPMLLLTYLFSQMLSSLVFVVLILGSHWAQGRFFQAPEQGNMPHGSYRHLFLTTLDWFTQPRWLGYWLGQLNLHLTHHIFPNWNHRHYRALAQIIAEVAAQHGVDYRCVTLREVLIEQQRFLRAMGKGH